MNIFLLHITWCHILSKEIFIEIIDDSQQLAKSGPMSTGEATSIRKTLLEEKSLNESIKTCDKIIEAMEKETSSNGFKVDSVSFSLGLTAKGKVAFLGTGASLGGTTSISVTFKKQVEE